MGLSTSIVRRLGASNLVRHMSRTIASLSASSGSLIRFASNSRCALARLGADAPLPVLRVRRPARAVPAGSEIQTEPPPGASHVFSTRKGAGLRGSRSWPNLLFSLSQMGRASPSAIGTWPARRSMTPRIDRMSVSTSQAGTEQKWCSSGRGPARSWMPSFGHRSKPGDLPRVRTNASCRAGTHTRVHGCRRSRRLNGPRGVLSNPPRASAGRRLW